MALGESTPSDARLHLFFIQDYRLIHTEDVIRQHITKSVNIQHYTAHQNQSFTIQGFTNISLEDDDKGEYKKRRTVYNMYQVNQLFPFSDTLNDVFVI